MNRAPERPSSPPRYLTAALYQFVALSDCDALKAPLQRVCETNGVKGTLLLAPEGINGTISGPQAGVRAVLAHLRADGRLKDLVHKESWAPELPFLRMKVRVKKEIVTLGVPGVSPTVMAGAYVKPRDWNALISRPDVVLVDTRNDYEVDIGTFTGAVDPRIKTFSDLPAWVAQQEQSGALLPQGGKKPAVAMFCSGGIRCEKSTAFLKMKGYGEVYHLEGGILKYLEDVPRAQSLWQGECFVFDERVSVGHGLTPGPYELCRSCRYPVGDAQRASPLFERGVSCPRCFDARSSDEKAALLERQKQVELAHARGVAHVGAAMPAKPRRLPDPVAHLMNLLDASTNSAKKRAGPGADNAPERRILIALAGLPGSGKSILANKIVDEVNVKSGFEVAVALGMDGFHLRKAQLAAFPNPQEAFKRRGAPWTFDAAALSDRLGLLRQLRQPAVPDQVPENANGPFPGVTWPGFEHGVGDPVADAVYIGPAVRLVIVEGLYLLHEGDGWHVAQQFDECWYLDVRMKLAMQRLVARHMRANGNTREQAECRLAVNDRLNADIVQATRGRAQWLVNCE